jgi:uncharacterized protein YrrD
MLSKTSTLKGYRLDTLDGEIGRVKEFYFDDRRWTIRYLVANSGAWLIGRQVLIAPYALVAINVPDQSIAIDLTREQVKASPALDSEKPVSRQFEESYYGHYGWPAYWEGPYGWGNSPTPDRNRERTYVPIPGEQAWDHHLRSTQAVSGYDLHAPDGDIGHVEDFIIDDETWAIRYLIVNTGNWWPGKQVLVSPQWILRVSWSESKIFINVSREAILQSPEYTNESQLTRDFEIGLHTHYHRKGYWIEELVTR